MVSPLVSTKDRKYVRVKFTPGGLAQKSVSPTSSCVRMRGIHVPVFVNTSEGFVNAVGTLDSQPVMLISERLHKGNCVQGGGNLQILHIEMWAPEFIQKNRCTVSVPYGKLKVITVPDPALDNV